MKMAVSESWSTLSISPLSSLHCPYCGSELEQVVHIPRMEGLGAETQADYGVLRCGCAQYPVVEGIPILQHIEGLKEVIQFVKEKNTHRALLQTMNLFRVKWARRNRWQQASYYLNCRRLIAGRRLTFQDAVELVRKPKVFADYLLHRYANPSFLADVALLPFLGAFLDSTASARGSTPCRVLDLACGAGHSSFLIQHWFPESSVVSVDQDFVSLYLSKRFLAPLADYVCTDVEAPSPFPALHFDAVHCLDAFHYFRSKRAIVTELRRVAKTGALWLFPHLHNALEENVTAGIPLSPENYARCFEFLRPMLFDEADLLRHVCDDGFTTRRAAKSLSDLSKAQTVALVAGGAVDTLPGQDLSSWICRKRSSLRINPIYKSRWTGTTLRLELHWPNDVLHRECQAVESILPRTCEVTRNELDLLLNGDLSADHELVRRLVCRFVLVPLPSGYSRHDPTSTVMFH